MTAFVEPGNLADILFAFNRNTHGAMPTLPRELIKRIKVTTTHLGYKRRYTLAGTGTQSARNMTFSSEKYGKISIEQYFFKGKVSSAHNYVK